MKIHTISDSRTFTRLDCLPAALFFAGIVLLVMGIMEERNGLLVASAVCGLLELTPYLMLKTTRRRSAIQPERMRSAVKRIIKAGLSSRLAMIEDMAVGFSHEINNSLTSVIGFSEFLLKKRRLPADIVDSLKMIHGGGEDIQAKIQKRLNFAHPESSGFITLNIHALMDNTLEFRDYHLRKSNISVIKHYAADLEPALVQPAELQQVFLDVLVNAQRSMSTLQNKKLITISTQNKGNKIRITITYDAANTAPIEQDNTFGLLWDSECGTYPDGFDWLFACYALQENKGTLRFENSSETQATCVIELPIQTG